MRERAAGAIVGLLVLTIAAVAVADEVREVDGGIESLAWMAGYWSSTSPGGSSEECWLPPAGGMLVGVHRTVRGGGAFFENLRIEARADAIVYVASPAGGAATEFRLSEQQAARAIFENLEHDFPKRITYWREDDVLHATAEGDGKNGPRRESWAWQRADWPSH